MRKIAVLSALLLAAAPAMAQQQPQRSAPVPAARPAAGQPKSLTEQIDRQVQYMHRRLQITPEQEQAWSTFAQTMRDNAMATEQAYRDRAARFETMGAVENLQSFAQIEQARADGVQKLLASFQTLYNSLSDEQKKTADDIFRRREERAEQRHQAHK